MHSFYCTFSLCGDAVFSDSSFSWYEISHLFCYHDKGHVITLPALMYQYCEIHSPFHIIIYLVMNCVICYHSIPVIFLELKPDIIIICYFSLKEIALYITSGYTEQLFLFRKYSGIYYTHQQFGLSSISD